MKPNQWLLFLCIWQLPFLYTFAQTSADYRKVDAHALNVPAAQTKRVGQLANYLTKPFEEERDQVRAIYTWITHHILYADSSEAGANLWATPQDLYRQRPDQVLRNRTAVCLGYANLFQAMAKAAGLPCEVVNGIVRQPDGEVPEEGHAWIAVRINRFWRLIDPTWGVVKNNRPDADFERYFLTPPAQFVLSHLPDDPMWQLLANPLTEPDFRNWSEAKMAAWVSATPTLPFDYRDTLYRWSRLDTLERFEAAAGRMVAAHPNSDRIFFEVGRNHLQQFINLYYVVDSTLGETIFVNHEKKPDTARLNRQFGLLERYHAAANSAFQKVKSADYTEKIAQNRFWGSIDGLTDKLRGDLNMALFSYWQYRDRDLSTEKQLSRLSQLVSATLDYYDKAVRRLDCQRLRHFCETTTDYGSQLCLAVGAAHRRFLTDKLTDKTWMDSHRPNFWHLAALGAQYLLRADSLTRRISPSLRLQGSIEGQLLSIREELTYLHFVRLKSRCDSITSLAYAAYREKTTAVSQAKNIGQGLLDTYRQLNGFADSISKASFTLYRDNFKEIMAEKVRFNCYLNRRAAATLYYDLTLSLYNQSVTNGNTNAQRNDIETFAKATLEVLDTVSQMHQMPDLLKHEELKSERALTQKLKRQINELMGDLRR